MASIEQPETVAVTTSLTYRSLRRLQSAQNLGQDARNNGLNASLRPQQQQPLFPLSTNQESTPLTSHLLHRENRHTRVRSNSDATIMSSSSAGHAPAKRPHLAGRRSVAGDLDRLIRDGPPDGDISAGLDSMRLKILDQGIKSDSDGMVCNRDLHTNTF